ncbi:DUF6678 family protein [Hymenobacter norwichensis]|uniref:DUF6678 family protein n=1 Tax=Hymenobacter norwichensis TaxID=223903 RepID=UPI003CCC2569
MVTHLVIDKLTDNFRVRTRAKMYYETRPSEWSNWFLIPVSNYLEASSSGPCSIEEVEWIEIHPIVVTHVGCLVKPLIRSYRNEIREQLESEGIRFEMQEQMVRVFLS